MTVASQQVKATAELGVQAAVTTMAFSAFSSALGILMTGTSMSIPPSQSIVTQEGLRDLREAYGDNIVNAAIKAAGTKNDIVTIAEAVEQEFNRYLNTKFTPFEITTAIRGCPSGDLRCVLEVCNSLHNKGITQGTAPSVTANVTARAAEVAKRRSPAVGHTRRAVMDTKTGIKYQSMYAFAMAVAKDYGVDPAAMKAAGKGTNWSFAVERKALDEGRMKFV